MHGKIYFKISVFKIKRNNLIGPDIGISGCRRKIKLRVIRQSAGENLNAVRLKARPSTSQLFSPQLLMAMKNYGFPMPMRMFGMTSLNRRRCFPLLRLHTCTSS